MIYEMPRVGQDFAGCGSASKRDKWYFLNLHEYPKLFNERVLEHLYDCGPLTLEELQKKEMGIKDIVFDNIKAEIEFGSVEAYKQNGVTKYRLTEEGKSIVEMLKERVNTWENEKRLRSD
jgi:hypothetical protein